MLTPGRQLHRLWREQFKHRWGGNVPSWSNITAAERGLWATVEQRFVQSQPKEITMKVIVIPANFTAPVIVADIPNELRPLQELVDGQIETCQVGPKAEVKGPLAVFFNDEGKIMDEPLPHNERATLFLADAGLRPDDWIAGDFVITGFDLDWGDSIDSPLSVDDVVGIVRAQAATRYRVDAEDLRDAEASGRFATIEECVEHIHSVEATALGAD